MRSIHASVTAEVVAVARALTSDKKTPHGATARAILPRHARAMVALLDAPGTKRYLPARARELIDHLALRCAILDHELESAVARGLTQVVILGAGLDTRAHRLTGLSTADVFEVDHPSSQAAKRRAARELPQRARSLRYISVDFERQALSERLAESGHDARRASVFLLEGVVPYLGREAIDSTLAHVSKAAAPGSALLLTYVPDRNAWYERMRWLSDVALRVAGEPLRSPLAPAALHAMVERAGLSVESDRTPLEWQAVLGQRSATPPIALERLLAARK